MPKYQLGPGRTRFWLFLLVITHALLGLFWRALARSVLVLARRSAVQGA